MGLVHIYFGDGKGKTTAALGLALRALGDGLRVCVCQFLKGAESGEVEALRRFEKRHAAARAGGARDKFLWQMDEEERAACLSGQRALLDCAAAADADVYVLDEVTDAAQAGAFSIETLLKRLEALRGRGEVILTGHEVPDALLDRADYITRMQKLRHPYDHGISARRGIEY